MHAVVDDKARIIRETFKLDVASESTLREVANPVSEEARGLAVVELTTTSPFDPYELHYGELVAAEVADDVQYDPGNERVRS